LRPNLQLLQELTVLMPEICMFWVECKLCDNGKLDTELNFRLGRQYIAV